MLFDGRLLTFFWPSYRFLALPKSFPRFPRKRLHIDNIGLSSVCAAESATIS